VGARVRRGLRAAVQTYYTVVFYNTVTRVLKWLGAGSFFERVTPRLERAYARLSGAAECREPHTCFPYQIATFRVWW